MANVLERIVGHREFQALPYEEQTALMSNILGQISPDLANDPEALTTASERAIRQYRPRTAFERVGSFVSGFIPIAGPLLQQYAWQENVPPPQLLSMMGITDDDNPYGGLIRAGLDIPLMIGGGLVGGAAVRFLGQQKYLPSLLNRTLPAMFSRELVAGAASGTGELVLDPPHSVGEAGVRLGFSAVAQAGVTTTFRGLFGRDARFDRAVRGELGKEGIAAFNAKQAQGDYLAITDQEIGAFERALGTRTDQDAVNARQGLEDLKRRRNVIFQQNEMAENTAALARQQELNADVQAGRAQAITREQDIQYQEDIVRAQQAANFQATQEGLAAEQARIAQPAPPTDFRMAARQAQLREADIVAQEQMAFSREAGQRIELENARVAEVDGTIQRMEAGPTERGTAQLLGSERQLITLLNESREKIDPNATYPLLTGEPTTLPIAMIQDLGGGNSRAVVVERLDGNRAELRYLGAADRSRLRLAATADETAAIRRIEGEQDIRAYPDSTQAREILQSRVNAERFTRLATIEARRFNAEEPNVQREIFRLRQEASLSYLEAHNARVSSEVKDAVRNVKTIDGKRTIASIEGLSATDAEAAAKALRSAGFEHVRIALDPAGAFEITFANSPAYAVEKAGRLYNRSVAYRGTVDPTSGSTYNGLSPAEHDLVGAAFGLSVNQRSTFGEFVLSYAQELRDRGIRFPVTTEAMGVDLIEEQIARGLKAPQKMRSEIIARSVEDVRRIEAGDMVEYEGSKGRTQLYVASKDVTHDPNGLGNGVVTYRTVPIQMLAELQNSPDPWPTIPLTHKQFEDMGMKRSVEFPIAAEQASKFSLDSPSRNIGDLFGLQRNQMPVPVVDANPRAMYQAAQELGMKISVDKNGRVRLSGAKVDLTNLTSEDAALMLSRLKQMQQDRTTLLDFFRNCV